MAAVWYSKHSAEYARFAVSDMENAALFTSWVAYLLATEAPSLPGLRVMVWSSHGLWALIMACGCLRVLRSWGCQSSSRRKMVWGSSATVALLALAPTAWSPAHWMGLAFQSPSLMTGAICSVWLSQNWRLNLRSESTRSTPTSVYFAVVGILLGWILGFDTWAALGLRQSFYAWGFSPVAVLVVAIVTLLPWILIKTSKEVVRPSRELLMVLAVLVAFVLTRLPNGNVWDALLDPWLWVVLHVHGLVRLTSELWRRSKLQRWSPR
jgi:hypothetical protein